MKTRITRHNGAMKSPFNAGFHNFCADWVLKDIVTNLSESIPSTFFLPEHVIVRLMLPGASVAQSWFQVCAEKFHRIELIACETQSHPHEMKMVRH